MLNIPNFNEFYQKALLPMNEYDRLNFCKEYCRECEHCHPVDHWLVALEGAPSDYNHVKYEWKVVVYPATETGVFSAFYSPHYQSQNPQSFSQALEAATIMIQNIENSKQTAGTMMAS